MNIKTLSALSISAVVLALTAGCGSDSNDDDGVTPPPATTGGDTTGGGGQIPANSGGGDSGMSAVIFDRMGRPGVSTALVGPPDRKDAYNLNGDPAAWEAAFLDDLVARMEVIDGLDGTTGNALLNDSRTLATLLVDDRLQIDTSQATCDVYLGIEIGLGGCGGRNLQADVIDDTLRHLVSQDMPVSDLADGATDIANISADWPFLGAPNP